MIPILLLLALQDDVDPKRHWSRLERESYSRRDEALRRSIDEANERLKKDPHDGSALTQRGTARGRMGDRDGAVEDLEKAISIDPKNVEACLALGEVWLERERYPEAHKTLSRAIEINASLPRAFHLRGVACEKDKRLADRYDRALADYTSALTLDAKLVPARLARAGILEKLKRDDESRADCDVVREILQDFLKTTYPDTMEQIDGVRKKDPEKYRKFLKSAWDKHQAYQELRAANPEEFDLLVKLQWTERRIAEVASRLRDLPDGEEKQKARQELLELVGTAFDLRQSLQSRELDALQKRIDSVREAMKEQSKNKPTVVEERVRDLERSKYRKKEEHHNEEDK